MSYSGLNQYILHKVCKDLSKSVLLSSTAASILATVIELVEADPTLTAVGRREMASGVRTVAKMLKSEPHLLAADAATLSPLIAAALPLAVGVNGTRWRNAKSLLRKALKLVDPYAMPARSRASGSSWLAAAGWR